MIKQIKQINTQISELPSGAANDISDGYHTFGELYKVRCLLFVALIQAHKEKAWRASKNADGVKWDGWFICGLHPQHGSQITFHLPEKMWLLLEGIETHEINPYYDGHTSEDVLERLLLFVSHCR
jgi:hypothetical protein